MNAFSIGSLTTIVATVEGRMNVPSRCTIAKAMGEDSVELRKHGVVSSEGGSSAQRSKHTKRNK